MPIFKKLNFDSLWTNLYTYSYNEKKNDDENYMACNPSLNAVSKQSNAILNFSLNKSSSNLALSAIKDVDDNNYLKSIGTSH